MKIICTDNFARESIADRLVASGLENNDELRVMVDALNEKFSGDRSTAFYKAVEDDFRLSRGMADLI